MARLMTLTNDQPTGTRVRNPIQLAARPRQFGRGNRR